MSRALRAVAAALAVAAAPSASAFVRTSTKDGLCVWWNPRRVAFRVNAASFAPDRVPACTVGGVAVSQAKAGFATWSHAGDCTDFEFVDGGDTDRTELGYDPSGDNVNLVVVRRGLCSAQADALCHPSDGGDLSACIQKYNCWSHDEAVGTDPGATLALTTVTYVQQTGELVDADMELNGWNGNLDAAQATGAYFTCAPPGSGTCPQPYRGTDCIEWDIQNTVTHEAGHVLGLAHACITPGDATCHPEATMAPNAQPGETSKRVLAPDDVSGVCTIYPAGQPTVTCGTITVGTEDSGCGGCSGGGAGGIALLGVLLSLWRRALRARARPTR
jgi:hypothetical protein